MKKPWLGFLIVLIMTVFIAQTAFGTNPAGTRIYQNHGFNAISVSSAMNLTVNQGEKYEVTVISKESQLKILRVKQYGKKLDFSLPPFTFTTAPIKIYITMPELTKLDLSGNSTANLMMNIPNRDFSADLSGNSEIIGSIQARNIDFDLSGDSQITLKGQAALLKVSASGHSQLQGESFQVNQAYLDLSGASSIYLFVKDLMEVDASGGSQVYYRGNPKLGENSFSGGSGMKSLE